MINLTEKEFESIREIMYQQTGVFLKKQKSPLL